MSRFPDPESSLGKSWYPVALFIIITTVFYGLILHSSEISPTFA